MCQKIRTAGLLDFIDRSADTFASNYSVSLGTLDFYDKLKYTRVIF